jgi:hypothetical protein
MNIVPSIIKVEVDFDILKDYHPLLSVQRSFLLEKGVIDINKVNDIVTYPYWSQTQVLEIVNKLEHLFRFEHKIPNWKWHRDHFLFITDIFMRDEVVNSEFKKYRRNDLKSILNNIVQLRELQQSKRKPCSILINNTIEVNGYLTASKTVHLIEQELTKLYNENQIDDSLPKITDDNLKELSLVAKQTNPKTATSYDKMIGYLSFVLKTYLEEQTHLKAKDKINFKNKKITLSLSNGQGVLIYSYLQIFKLITPKSTPPHIRIRRYINVYLKDIV